MQWGEMGVIYSETVRVCPTPTAYVFCEYLNSIVDPLYVFDLTSCDHKYFKHVGLVIAILIDLCYEFTFASMLF